MSSDVHNNPGTNLPGVEIDKREEDSINLNDERSCCSQTVSDDSQSTQISDGRETCVHQTEQVSDEQDVETNVIGTTNLAYSSDSVNVLPVLSDLNEQCKHRYSVVIDNLDNSDDDNDYSEALAGPSSSSLGYSIRMVSLEKSCSCNCHRREQNIPSYDDATKNDMKVTSLNHDNINCNGVSCSSAPTYRTHAHNLMLGVGNVRNSSPNCTPGNTPGRFRRTLPSQMVKILNSRGNSPSSGKAPPNYRSLIFSILQDEPPKYEEVTGKKLADELVATPHYDPSVNVRIRPSLTKRFIGIGTFMIIVTVTVLLLYLSAAVLESKRKLDWHASRTNYTKKHL